MIVVRFVNEKRARNEQRKERRERGNECERRRADSSRAAGLRAERAGKAAICAMEGEREFEGRGACSCSSTNHSYRSQQSCTRRRRG